MTVVLNGKERRMLQWAIEPNRAAVSYGTDVTLHALGDALRGTDHLRCFPPSMRIVGAAPNLTRQVQLQIYNARSRAGIGAEGEKQVELRRYAIPEEFLEVPVYLLCTPDGNEGQSTLPPDTMPAAQPGVWIAGTVTFNGQVAYSSYGQWLADSDKHCVDPGTPYSWQPGVTQEMFGWQIASVQAAAAPQPVPAMRRVLSSWFKVAYADIQHPN